MRAELLRIKELFDTPRRTFIDLDAEPDIDIEELIQREDMVVTVTHKGWIKRVPLASFRAQRRGGKGKAGMRTQDDDFVARMFVASTHTPVLFFSSLGRVYKLKVYRLPLGTPQARGRAMINMFPALAEGESISAVMPLPEDEALWETMSVFFATGRGKVRRNELADFIFVPGNGKIAMGLDEGDRLVGAEVCDDGHDIILAAAGGRAIRFPVDAVRVFKSRSSEGVNGMDLEAGDEVISMSVIDHVEVAIEERDEYLRVSGARRRQGDEADGEAEESGELALLSPERFAELEAKEQLLLTITVNGFGKRTSASSTGSPTGAGRGSSTSRPRPATAGSRRPSRSARPTRSCWSPTRARPSASRCTTSASPAGTRRASSCSRPSPTSTSSRPRAWRRSRATPRPEGEDAAEE